MRLTQVTCLPKHTTARLPSCHPLWPKPPPGRLPWSDPGRTQARGAPGFPAATSAARFRHKASHPGQPAHGTAPARRSRRQLPMHAGHPGRPPRDCSPSCSFAATPAASAAHARAAQRGPISPRTAPCPAASLPGTASATWRDGSGLPPPHLLQGPTVQHLEMLQPGVIDGIQVAVEFTGVITGEPARAPVRRSVPPGTRHLSGYLASDPHAPGIFDSHNVLPISGRAECAPGSSEGDQPARWHFSSSCHSSPASWVITAHKPPEPGSRQASNISPRQPGQMPNENSGNAVRNRTSSARTGKGTSQPGVQDGEGLPASARNQASGPARSRKQLGHHRPAQSSRERTCLVRLPGSGPIPGNPGTSGARTRPGPWSSSPRPRPAASGGTSSHGPGTPGSCPIGHLCSA